MTRKLADRDFGRASWSVDWMERLEFGRVESEGGGRELVVFGQQAEAEAEAEERKRGEQWTSGMKVEPGSVVESG